MTENIEMHKKFHNIDHCKCYIFTIIIVVLWVSTQVSAQLAWSPILVDSESKFFRVWVWENQLNREFSQQAKSIYGPEKQQDVHVQDNHPMYTTKPPMWKEPLAQKIQMKLDIITQGGTNKVVLVVSQVRASMIKFSVQKTQIIEYFPYFPHMYR